MPAWKAGIFTRVFRRALSTKGASRRAAYPSWLPVILLPPRGEAPARSRDRAWGSKGGTSAARRCFWGVCASVNQRRGLREACGRPAASSRLYLTPARLSWQPGPEPQELDCGGFFCSSTAFCLNLVTVFPAALSFPFVRSLSNWTEADFSVPRAICLLKNYG